MNLYRHIAIKKNETKKEKKNTFKVFVVLKLKLPFGPHFSKVIYRNSVFVLSVIYNEQIKAQPLTLTTEKYVFIHPGVLLVTRRYTEKTCICIYSAQALAT